MEQVIIIKVEDIDKFIEKALPYNGLNCLCGHDESCGYCDGTYDRTLEKNRKNLKEILLSYAKVK